MELPQDFTQEVQQVWQRFLQRTEPLRPDLHRYCRALTGSVWDVEDKDWPGTGRLSLPACGSLRSAFSVTTVNTGLTLISWSSATRSAGA